MDRFRLKGGDGPAQESRRRGRKPGVTGPDDGDMLFGLGAVGTRLGVQVGPTATVAASVVLIIVEFRVVPGWWLGAAIQEVGKWVGRKSCLGG